MKKIILIGMIAIIFIAVPAFAESADDQEYVMMVDVLAVRPFSLAATVFGTAVFIVALPFAIASGSVESVGRTLVAAPFRFTFTRPIGDFSSGGAESYSTQPVNPRVEPPPPSPPIYPGESERTR